MTAIQPMGDNPLIPYNFQMGQDPTDQKPKEEQNIAVAGMLDRFKVVQLQNEVDEKGAKHVEETIQDYFKEMNSTIAALVEENRLLRKERATSETELKLAQETHLNAMKQVLESNEQLSTRLDEAMVEIRDLKLFELSCSDVQPSKAFLDLYAKVKKLVEKILYHLNHITVTFDRNLLHSSPRDGLKRIIPWLEARNLLLFGYTLSMNIGKEAFTFPGIKTMKEVELKASSFNTWFKVHNLSIMGLTSLNLSFKYLTALPNQIFSMTNLTRLDLSNNCFETFPSGIGNLISLKYLSLQSNQIAVIPPEIGKLTNLEGINLVMALDSSMMELPKEMGNMTKLRKIECGGNQIKSIPVEFGNLTNLQGLYLGSNKIERLPKEIGELPKLERLHLSGNPISVNMNGDCNSLSTAQQITILKNQGKLH